MTTVRPPPGVSSSESCLCIASMKPRATEQAQSDSKRMPVIGEALEGEEGRYPAVARDPRSLVDNTQLHLSVVFFRIDADAAARVRHRVRDDVRHRSLEQDGVGPHVRQGFGHVDVDRSTRIAPMFAKAAPTISSRPTGCMSRLSPPVWSRLMSRRLPTSLLSLSVSASIVSRNSVAVSFGHSTSVCSKLVTDALIDDNGVRRSCETAASSAARRSFDRRGSASPPSRAARRARRVRSRSLRRSRTPRGPGRCASRRS